MNMLLRGKLTTSLVRFSWKGRGKSDYKIIFYKEHIPVACIVFHPDANQYIIETLDAGLILETLFIITPLMNIDAFRLGRRFLQSKIKHNRKLK